MQFPLTNDELTMSELQSTIERIFSNKLDHNDTLVYKYRDEGAFAAGFGRDQMRSVQKVI